tara:strand:+ start:548 stop:904 length:357 start_codon:yes stop_codon:yes gene_type:complete
MEKEEFMLWDYRVVLALKKEVKKLSKRVKLLLRQHIYQETNDLIQEKIVPLLCEYFVVLNNYLMCLDKLSEADNSIVVENKKKIIMMLDDIKLLQVLSSSRTICEQDLSIYNISVDMH